MIFKCPRNQVSRIINNIRQCIDPPADENEPIAPRLVTFKFLTGVQYDIRVQHLVTSRHTLEQTGGNNMIFSFRCAIPENGPSLFEIELPKIERHMHLQDNRLGVPRYNIYSPKIFIDSLLDSLWTDPGILLQTIPFSSCL